MGSSDTLKGHDTGTVADALSSATDVAELAVDKFLDWKAASSFAVSGATQVVPRVVDERAYIVLCCLGRGAAGKEQHV